MNRSTIDKLLSATGLVMAVALLAAAGGLFFAHNFVHSQVQSQLTDQRITFPAAGSEAITSLPSADRDQVAKYAGQQLLTGAQAKVFADNYIAVHLQKIGGGKTYSELSAEATTKPDDAKLAAQVSTMFRGETLRGLLLNVYAFDTMATIALIAGFGAIAAAVLLLILAALGIRHARLVERKA